MTEAPERIWAKPNYDEWLIGGWDTHGKAGGVQYVRADLCPDSDTIEHLTQERDRFAERIDELVAQLAALVQP